MSLENICVRLQYQFVTLVLIFAIVGCNQNDSDQNEENLTTFISPSVTEGMPILVEITSDHSSQIPSISWTLRIDDTTIKGRETSNSFTINAPLVDTKTEVYISITGSIGSHKLSSYHSVIVEDSITEFMLSNLDLAPISILDRADGVIEIDEASFPDWISVDENTNLVFDHELMSDLCGTKRNLILSLRHRNLGQVEKEIHFDYLCATPSHTSGFYEGSIAFYVDYLGSEGDVKIIADGSVVERHQELQIESKTTLEIWIEAHEYQSSKLTLNIQPNYQPLIISENAATLWLNQPSSHAIESENGMVTLAYEKYGKIFIKTFNLKNETVPQERLIYDYEKHYRDDHSAPSLIVLGGDVDDSDALLFFSFHNSPLYTARISLSENAGEPLIRMLDESATTYPQPLQLSESHYLVFYRTKVEHVAPRQEILKVVETLDGGITWSIPREIVNFGPGYWIYSMPPIANDDSITLLFNVYNTEERKYRDVFVSTSFDRGKTWSSNTGDTDSPITELTAIKILGTGTKGFTRIKDFKSIGDQLAFTTVTKIQEDSANEAKYYTIDKGQLNEYPSLGYLQAPYYASGVTIDPKDSNSVWIVPLQDCDSSCLIKLQLTKGGWRKTYHIDQPHGLGIMNPQTLRVNGSNCLTWLQVRSYSRYTTYDTDFVTNCALN